MTKTEQARGMKALLESAAAIADDISHDLTDACETRGAPAEVDLMMGQSLGIEPQVERLQALLTALKALHGAKVQA